MGKCICKFINKVSEFRQILPYPLYLQDYFSSWKKQGVCSPEKLNMRDWRHMKGANTWVHLSEGCVIFWKWWGQPKDVVLSCVLSPFSSQIMRWTIIKWCELPTRTIRIFLYLKFLALFLSKSFTTEFIQPTCTDHQYRQNSVWRHLCYKKWKS